MRVVEEEYIPKRVKCNNCDRVLEYDSRDVKTEQTHMNEYSSYVICPVCNNKVRV